MSNFAPLKMEEIQNNVKKFVQYHQEEISGVQENAYIIGKCRYIIREYPSGASDMICISQH